MREAFVKERNDALFSMDRKKIEAYCSQAGDTETAELPESVILGRCIISKPAADPQLHPNDKCGNSTWLRLMVSQTA